MENSGRYWEAVGRRKTAIARVRLFTRGEKGMWVNGKEYHAYFQYPSLFLIPEDPLKKMKSFERFRVTANIHGGGIHAQAEAFRHGISRALVKFNQDFRKRLKRANFLTRDSRMKERKKFGLKGARRAPQWAKR
ncbi:MAG: 30S ribosomal protein S9 [bacterium]|nr:30S ribosomal protein S9 [bacterium]